LKAGRLATGLGATNERLAAADFALRRLLPRVQLRTLKLQIRNQAPAPETGALFIVGNRWPQHIVAAVNLPETSPEVRVETARLVPCAVTHHQIRRDDEIVR